MNDHGEVKYLKLYNDMIKQFLTNDNKNNYPNAKHPR